MKKIKFYLKNGNTFEIKAKSVNVSSSKATGDIVGYEVTEPENFFSVNVSEIIAIVENLEDENEK